MTLEGTHKPRVGIPYRTRNEELNNERNKYSKYVDAVRRAGGEPIEISLQLSLKDLTAKIRDLDAVVLPGSPADIHPLLYKAQPHPRCSFSDPRREATDFALLEHAFEEHKPVLAICYGIQSLNVILGGTLVQDIPSQLHTEIQHPWTGRDQGAPEPFHGVRIEPGSRLAQWAGAGEVQVNSSHHQSVEKLGRNLRVVAQAPDGVVEAVEWTDNSCWVTGVQWHPERMRESGTLAQALFGHLVAAARKAAVPS